MIGTRTIARSLLASAFVVLGAKSLQRSGELEPVAEQVTDKIADAAGVDASTKQLVQVNAGVQIAGGALLAIGVGRLGPPHSHSEHHSCRRPSQAIASGNPRRRCRRNSTRWAYVKNAAILGGLLFAALDTGGRPSVFWSGRKAAVTAADAVSSVAQQAYSTVAT